MRARVATWLAGIAIAILGLSAAIVSWPARGPALLEPLVVSTVDGSDWIDMPASAGFPLLLASLAAFVALPVRFRRARGDDRQQLKWPGDATAVALAYFAGLTLLDSLNDEERLRALREGSGVLFILGIAILRHRLWDTDRFIGRTLGYRLVAVALAAISLGSVAQLQLGVRVVTGQDSQGAVVASALASDHALPTAAADHPVHDRSPLLSAQIQCRPHTRGVRRGATG